MLTADPGYEYAEGLGFQIKVGEKTEKRQYPKRDQFAAEISYFSDCILNDREPEPSGQEGLADIRVVEGIYTAVKSGRVVKLPPFDKEKTAKLTPRRSGNSPTGKPETVDVTSPSGR